MHPKIHGSVTDHIQDIEAVLGLGVGINVGDRGLPSAERRCVLWAYGAAADGLLYLVSYRTVSLHRGDDDGGERVEPQT